MTLHATDARQLEAQGREYLSAGRYREASEVFIQAIDMDPTLGGAAIALVEAYRGRAMPSAALQACQQALTIVTDDHGLRLNLAWLHFEVRDYASAIREAQAVLDLNGGLELESYRSLIFSTAAAGDWADTGRLLDRVEHRFPDSVAGMAAEVASTFAGGVYAAVEARDDSGIMERFERLPRQIALSPAFKLRELQAVVAACHFRNRSFSGGLDLFSRAIGSPATVAPVGGVAVITSLMPARLDDQARAVASWSALGCTIVSVNDFSEISLLKPLFPQVSFVPAPRNALTEVGRPLVFIDDLLAAAKTASEPTVGIVNSDIILKPSNVGFLASLQALSQTSILFGNRIDTETPECDPGGPIYREGYDWFFFRKERADLFAGSGLVFGAPWWDLWLPACAILSGVELINLRQPAAYHHKHPTAWNATAFQIMGRRFAAAIGTLGAAQTPRSAAAKALLGVSEALGRVGGGEAASDDAIVRLSPVASAIVQGAMTLV